MMNILLCILLVLVGIIALVLMLALLMKKHYYINREIIINANTDQVFGYIKQLKNQDKFNKWAMADPDMKKDFNGTDGTVGFIYAWNGNKKAGEGEQEIKSITEGKKMETEIRFVRPIPSTAFAVMSTEKISENQTKVNWSNAGKMIFPMNIMRSMIENMLSKDMDISLNNLKNILEK